MPGVSGHRGRISRLGSLLPKSEPFLLPNRSHTFQWLLLIPRQETGLSAGQQKLQEGCREGRKARKMILPGHLSGVLFPRQARRPHIVCLRVMSPLCCDKDTPKILSQHKPSCGWQSLSNCAPASCINEREWGYFASVRGREVTPVTLKHHQPSLPLSLSSLSGARWDNENGVIWNTACPPCGLKTLHTSPSPLPWLPLRFLSACQYFSPSLY